MDTTEVKNQVVKAQLPSDQTLLHHREQVDMEARNLIHELNIVNTTLKLGSIEREQKEDFIYKKLYYLAEEIKQKHYHDKSMRELYYLITNDPLPYAPEVSSLPVYPDKYKMFTKSPPNPKVNLFLANMATTLNTMNPKDVQRRLSDPTKDGPKEILESFVSHTHREKGFEMGSEKTCKNCWNDVMRPIFMMTIEMLTVELKARAEQILTLTKTGHLTPEDAISLAGYISKVIHKMEKMLESTISEKKGKKERKGLTKTDWIKLVESLFQLMVDVINEIMMRYVKMSKMRLAIQNDEKLSPFMA
jgi:hypothetical protein